MQKKNNSKEMLFICMALPTRPQSGQSDFNPQKENPQDEEQADNLSEKS